MVSADKIPARLAQTISPSYSVLIVLKDAQRRGIGSVLALGACSLYAAFPLLLPPCHGWVSCSLRTGCELGDVLLETTHVVNLPPILQLSSSTVQLYAVPAQQPR